MKKRKIYSFTLLFLILFHLVNIFNWLNAHIWPYGKDCLYHLENACRVIQNGGYLSGLKSLIFIDVGYPPFYYWTALILYNLFGSYQFLFLNSAVYYIVLILTVYGIGKNLRDKDTGILAATFCSFLPEIYYSAIDFNLELATGAMVALVIYTLLLSQNFKNLIFSVIAGFALLFGLLTRQLIVPFVIGPIVLTLIPVFLPEQARGKALFRRRIKNFVFFLLISSVALIYYHNIKTFHNLWSRIHDPGIMDSVNIFSWPHLTYYVRILPKQIGWIMVVLFLLGLVRPLNLNRQQKQFLLSWFIIPFIVQTFVLAKFPVYTIGYLPVVALIAALTVVNIKRVVLRITFAGILSIVVMCNYFKNF